MPTQTYHQIKQTLENFDSITLQQLKESRRLFKRVDTKFVVDIHSLVHLLNEMSWTYDALDINDKKIFVYDTIYLDTPDYFFYNQHIDGVPLRTKVRTRHYVDSGLVYFEVKLKSKKFTNKYRIQLDESLHGSLNEQAWEFYKNLYFEAYWVMPDHSLIPQTKTVYKRITLAHKYMPEKVTIDLNLTFDEAGHDPFAFDQLVVVEVKSETKESEMSKVIEKYGYRQRKECSKYCLSLCYLDIANDKEYFANTMEMIDGIEALKHTYATMDAIEENAQQEIAAAKQTHVTSSFSMPQIAS